MPEVTNDPTPLEDLRSVAEELAEKWDAGMKAGKLLAHMEGRIDKYDPRISRIIAALAASPPEPRQTETGWQDIASAPRGEEKRYGIGPRVLGLIPGGHVAVVAFCRHADGIKGAWKGDANRVETPSMFMPLPAPPNPPAPLLGNLDREGRS